MLPFDIENSVEWSISIVPLKKKEAIRGILSPVYFIMIPTNRVKCNINW